jgi:hypothetical protein
MPYVLLETAFGRTSKSLPKCGRIELTKEKSCIDNVSQRKLVELRCTQL